MAKVIIELSMLTFLWTECSDNQTGVLVITAEGEAYQLEGDERFHPCDFILWHQYRLRLLYEEGNIMASDIDQHISACGPQADLHFILIKWKLSKQKLS
jgi:hypothetical protein